MTEQMGNRIKGYAKKDKTEKLTAVKQSSVALGENKVGPNNDKMNDIGAESGVEISTSSKHSTNGKNNYSNVRKPSLTVLGQAASGISESVSNSKTKSQNDSQLKESVETNNFCKEDGQDKYVSIGEKDIPEITGICKTKRVESEEANNTEIKSTKEDTSFDLAQINGTTETDMNKCLEKEMHKPDNDAFTNDDKVKVEIETDLNDMVSKISQTVPQFPCDLENISSKGFKAADLETLKHLIETLNIEETSLSEKLASMTRLIRSQSGENLNSEMYVTLLIKHNFTGKFENYLTSNDISAISDLNSEHCIQWKRYWPTVKRFLMLIWIACDQSVNFCQHTLASNIFQILQMDLKRLCYLKYADSDIQTFTVKAILGIAHNICRHVPNGKWKLRNDGLVSVVRLYLDSEVAMIRLKSLVILSYILSEAENEMINSEDENFIFIFKVLRDAVHCTSHRSSKYGMSVVEIMKGLNNLAINDENKIRIVRNGGLPFFEQILEEGSHDEIKVTITTLWSLAFHHYNKMRMREMPRMMLKLYELQHCKDEEICHAARGTFWELENISKSSIGSSVTSSLSADKDPSQPHIMISYQWDSQAVMMKVKDRLRHAGYKVWMDIEHMTGSTLEAMALAVEKAAVVLVCMSQKYKDSPNCRTEAEYVYRLRKDFVPLRLQREYIPDGWLGILVGTRLYFDVYSEDQLDVQVPRLTRELRDRGKISPSLDQPDHLPIVPQRMTSREAVPILHHPASPTVTNWTPVDVKHWIGSISLSSFAENFENMDGLLLLELQKIQETAPEHFHSILRNEFQLPVIEALRLSRQLRLLF